MKNLVAAIVLVLVGLSAGVGLNLFPIQTVVHGAPGDPNPALKSVAHDSTLTGDGTPTAPLGVVGGTNGRVRVVDSRGQLVGPLIGDSAVLRRIGDLTFEFGVNQIGFWSGNRLIFYHSATDCSDSRYMDPRRDALVTPSMLFGREELFYPADGRITIVWRAYEEVFYPSSPNLPGRCSQVNPESREVAQVVSQPFPSFGLTPPFHIEF